MIEQEIKLYDEPVKVEKKAADTTPKSDGSVVWAYSQATAQDIEEALEMAEMCGIQQGQTYKSKKWGDLVTIVSFERHPGQLYHYKRSSPTELAILVCDATSSVGHKYVRKMSLDTILDVDWELQK